MPNYGNAVLQSALIDTTTAGDNTIIAAVAAQIIRVWRLHLYTNGAVTVTLKNGAATNLMGGIAFIAQSKLEWPITDDPYFAMTVNTAFIINLSAAPPQVSGRIWYTQS